MSDEFDPYAVADDETRNTWRQFAESIGRIPQVTIEPDLYLKHFLPPPTFDGHTQETLDEGIAQVADIYRSSFNKVFEEGLQELHITQFGYVPPSAYGKGGHISAAYQVLQFGIDNPEISNIGQGVLESVLAEAVWSSGKELSKYFRNVRFPERERRLPVHDVSLILATCGTHAREYYGDLRPKSAQSFTSFLPPSPDLPVLGNVYTVVVLCRYGSIIYVVTERMILFSHLRVHSKGGVPLDVSTWYAKFS